METMTITPPMIDQRPGFSPAKRYTHTGIEQRPPAPQAAEQVNSGAFFQRDAVEHISKPDLEQSEHENAANRLRGENAGLVAMSTGRPMIAVKNCPCIMPLARVCSDTPSLEDENARKENAGRDRNAVAQQMSIPDLPQKAERNAENRNAVRRRYRAGVVFFFCTNAM